MGNDGLEACVGLHWSQPQLCNQSVNLVENQHHSQPFLPSLPQHRMGLNGHPLHCINQYKATISQPSCSGNLRAKVNMSRGIDEVDQVFCVVALCHGLQRSVVPSISVVIVKHDVYTRLTVQYAVGTTLLLIGWTVQQADAAAFHGDATRLFLLLAVHKAQLTSQAGVDEAIAGNEVVGQRCLAMVNVCHDAQVANEILCRGGAILGCYYRLLTIARTGWCCICTSWAVVTSLIEV